MAHPTEREILVIHPGALGDLLQAVPALRALRRGDGGRRLALAAQPRLAGLLAAAGEVDEALSFEGLGLGALFAGEPPPPALRSRLGRGAAVVSWFAASDQRYAAGLRALSPSAVIAPPVPDSTRPGAVWQHLVATLGAWAPRAAPSLSPITGPDDWRAQAREALAALGVEPGRPVLAVHPGAGGAWKRWPARHLAHVVLRATRETACQVVVHQGPADHEATAELRDALGAPGAEDAIRWLVEPDLPLLAGVLRASAAFVGGDSGVSHLAAATGTAAVIVFPAATRERWAPWSPGALSLTAGTPEGDPDRVSEAVNARLSSPRAPRAA